MPADSSKTSKRPVSQFNYRSIQLFGLFFCFISLAALPPSSSAPTGARTYDVPRPAEQKQLKGLDLSHASIVHSANTLPMQTGGIPVVINFDDATVFDPVGSRYPRVTFSSPGGGIIAWTANQPSSRPNCAAVGGWGFTNGQADFVMTFTSPVNNLKFKIIDWDDFFTIALIDVYKNNVLTHQNLGIAGQGSRGAPTTIDLAWVSDVTKVVVHHISDTRGLGYDDISFTVASPSPTPTPTPTPTPPPAPTDLRALGDEESIDLTWNPVSNATGYILMRFSEVPEPATEFLAMSLSSAASSPAVFAPIATLPPSTVCLLGQPCKFHDPNRTPNVEYTYVVAAIGVGGTSANSNEASATALPKAGCEWEKDPPPKVNGIDTINHLGWSVNYTFTDTEGLVISSVRLNGRKMADRMSVPYYKISTLKDGQRFTTRGELRLDGSPRSDGQLFS